MRMICVAVVLSIALASSTGAQTLPDPLATGISGTLGAGRTWDDEGPIGNGLLAGVHLDRRLVRNTFIDVGVDWLRHDRSGRFTAEGRSVLFGASIVQRFGHGAAQPYVLGGVVVVRHSGTFGFPEDGTFTRTDSTDAGLAFGGGVAIRVGARFEVGPEARFITVGTSNDSAPAFAQSVGGRVGVRW
jgi:opacity protein-like surface antigen